MSPYGASRRGARSKVWTLANKETRDEFRRICLIERTTMEQALTDYMTKSVARQRLVA